MLAGAATAERRGSLAAGNSAVFLGAASYAIYPGEGHGLAKTPWHGYIKLREELKWLNEYDGN